MNEQLRWVLELVNRVSGPARAIQESIKNVTASAQKLKEASAQASGGVSSLSSSFGGLSRGVAVGNLAANAISSIARAAWEASKSFAAATLEAASFKENTLIGLKVLLKSAPAAREVYAEAERFAAITPFATQDVIKLYQQLITSGFSIEKNAKGISEVSALAETIGNAAAANGMSPEHIAGITKAIGDIKAKGKLSAQELLQLSNWGVGRMPIYEQLAKSLGKKVEDIPKMLEQGKIDGTDGINAIVSAIGGNYGGLMKEASQTLSGLWSTIKSRPFEMLADMADSDSFKQIKNFMNVLGQALDPASGPGARVKTRLLGFVNNIFGSMFGPLDQLGPDQIANVIIGIIDSFESAFNTVKKIVGGVVDVVLGYLRKIGDGDAGKGIEKIFDRIMDTVKVITKLIETMAEKIDLVMKTAETIKSLLPSLPGSDEKGGESSWFDYTPGGLLYSWAKGPEEMKELGKLSGQGYAAGIKESTPEVATAVTEMIRTTVAAAQGPQGIDAHSPSRVFAQLGTWSAQGMAQGLYRGAGMVNEAALAMVAAPNYAAAGAALAGSMSGNPSSQAANGKPTVNINEINVVVQGEAGASTEENIKRGALAAVSEAFEEMGWEMGLAPQ
jgi:tape measure domain-containing protein